MTARVVVSLPIAAAAEVLGASTSDVRRLLRAGELAGVYAGRTLQVDVNSLREATASSPLATWRLGQALAQSPGRQ